MSCPLCRQRKPRRHCPALGQSICSVCCGTKRLSEIACTPDCVYLASSREHPAAAVKRQQEQDAALIAPALRNLTERQLQLFFLFQNVIARHTPDGFARLVDEDIAEAAAATAATLETAARGVVYQHTPASLPAQRLATEFHAMLNEIRQQGVRLYDHEAAVVLRAIEQGARAVGRAAGGDDSYRTVMGRLLQMNRAAAETAEESTQGSSPIILP